MCSNVMENGIKLTAILESQSPMIHFQAQETGAVLRASEVKPKLDRFLIKKMIKNLVANSQLTNEEALKKLKEKHSEYFQDVKLNDALNYKMRIIATKVNEFSLEDGGKSRYAPFFANSGRNNDEEKLRGVFVTAELTIVCFNKTLRETIKKCLEEFFIVTNFGMMQGKGFGSFIVTGSVKTDNNGRISYNEIRKIAKQLEESVEAKSCYYMKFNALEGDVEDRLKNIYKDMFDEIKLFYGIMKSGYNVNGKYARSYIYDYMHNNYGLGNEKKWMKQNKIAPAIMHPDRIIKSADERHLASLSDCQTILESATKVYWVKGNGGVSVRTNHEYCDAIRDIASTAQSTEMDNEHDPKYVRALLGTAIQTEFKIGYYKNNRNNRWCLLGRDKNDKVQVTIADTSEELERVPSPIYFKIIKNIVFIAAKKIPEKIYGRTFKFSSCWESGTISTPSKEQLIDNATGEAFDIQTFLKEYVDYYNGVLRTKVTRVRNAKIIQEV